MQAVIYVWSYRRGAAAAPGSGDESQGSNRWISCFPSHRAGDGRGPRAGTRGKRPRSAWGLGGENLQNSQTGGSGCVLGPSCAAGFGEILNTVNFSLIEP